MTKFLSLLAASAISAAALAGPAVAPAFAQNSQNGKVSGGAVTVVTLRSQSVIEGEIIRLGDLFDGLEANGGKADIAIARAPAPGQRIALEARWLSAVAKRYGLPWSPLSHLDRAVIERSSVVLETDRIRDAIGDALAQNGHSKDLSIELDNPTAKIVLPGDADATMKITGLRHDPSNGRFLVEIAAPAEGIAQTELRLTGRAVEMAEIPVLRHRVSPGDIISAEDIDWISVRADNLSRNSARDLRDLLGKTPRRPLRVGEVIRTSELEAPTIVTKNSLVTIRLNSERMVLTVQGRALEDGTSDEAIRVMNTKSNKVVNARVVDPGTVEVLYAGLAAAQ